MNYQEREIKINELRKFRLFVDQMYKRNKIETDRYLKLYLYISNKIFNLIYTIVLQINLIVVIYFNTIFIFFCF